MTTIGPLEGMWKYSVIGLEKDFFFLFELDFKTTIGIMLLGEKRYFKIASLNDWIKKFNHQKFTTDDEFKIILKKSKMWKHSITIESGNASKKLHVLRWTLFENDADILREHFPDKVFMI
jgi:hypothetical protein